MNLRRSWGFYLVALAIGLTAVIGVRAGEAMKARPTKVAVADIEKVLNALREKGELESALTSAREKFSNENDAKKQELADKKSELDILNPDSPDYKKKQDELEQKSLEYRAWAEWQQEKLEREWALRFLGLYNKITAACGDVARMDGYDLVLYTEPTPAVPEGVKSDDLMNLIRGMMRSRKVLYASDDLDITDQVTQMMNNEYANRVGAAPAPQSAPGTPATPAPGTAGTPGSPSAK